MARRFRYTPPAKFSQCPSFVATFIRVETEGATKGWTTFKKDGDDDHLYSMYFTPEDNIEWIDENDTPVPALAETESSDTTSTSDRSSAVVQDPNPQPSRKPRKRKRKQESEETEQQQELEPADKNTTESNGLFDLLFMVAVILIVVGVVALGPGMLGFAAMFGAGGALARAE